MNGLTHRKRLLLLEPMLDDAPFDVEDLQQQLSQAHHLPDSDAAEVLRQTINELDRVRVELCLVNLGDLDDDELVAHRYAMDWLESARRHLLPYNMN